MGIFDYLVLDSRVAGLAVRMASAYEQGQERTATDIDALRDETAALRRDLEELALYSRAAVTLLIEKQLFSQDELIQRMTEIDLEDGIEDGQV
jgi:hypothetical protein